jgi:hypothetical protein
MDFDVFVRSLKNGKKMLIWDVLISHNTEAWINLQIRQNAGVIR